MQQGSDVVITASGSANINDLGVPLDATFFSHVEPQLNIALVGTAGVQHDGDAFIGLTATMPAGSTGMTLADSGSGDAFGVAGNQLVLPDNYTTGTMLSGSGTYENTSIATLGITEQTWNWGSGPNADSATLAIVPEPAVYAALFGLLALSLACYRRRVRVTQPLTLIN